MSGSSEPGFRSAASEGVHAPVLAREVVEAIVQHRGGRYVDGTLGDAGHARAILEKAGPDARLIGIDRDAEALDRARANLRDEAAQCRLVHGNFADIAALVAGAGGGRVDGVVLDLGVSSDQLEDGERGFSFMRDGPLDMRADPSRGSTAADLVNGLGEADLERTIREYGEEPQARRVARAIAAARKVGPIRTTGHLADIVARAAGGRRGRLHPATRTFQALRIAVNDELEALRLGLGGALAVLAPGGRLAVISFHRLEDRIVKRFALAHAAGRGAGSDSAGGAGMVRIVTRKPVTAGDEERRRNPRSRSAKLRIMERLAATE